MSRVHIVPVGVSLLDVIEDTWPPRLRDALADRDLWKHLAETVHAGGTVTDTLLGVGDHDSGEVRAELDTLKPKHCAEWHALDRYRDEFGGSDTDTWVFVGTDTETGSRAAALVALGHLHRHQNLTLHYLDTPGDGHASYLHSGRAYLMRLPGLNLAAHHTVPDSAWQAMGELGALLALAVSNAHHRHETVFHLSGGYKAALPYFLTVAQAVRTTNNGRYAATVSAYSLHEHSNRPIPLPVPYLTGTPLDLMKHVASTIDSDTTVADDVATDLIGLYLESEVRQGRRRLTPEGTIVARTLWALHKTV